MKITIRRAGQKDAKLIYAIYSEVYTKINKNDGLSKKASRERMTMHNEAAMQERLRGNYFFLAIDQTNDKPVGVIGLRRDENSKVHNRVSTFDILEEYRGMGIGGRLYKKVLNLAKKLGVKKLVVSANLSAVEMYSHWGFKKTKEVVKNYSTGESYTNVWMEKDIS